MLGQLAEARFGEGIRSGSDLDGPSIDRNELSTFGFEDPQSVLATSGHGFEQVPSIVLEGTLDQHFVRQSEAKQMNAASFADAFVVKAFGCCSGGVQGCVASGAREIVLSEGETIRRKKGTRPPIGRSGLTQKRNCHPNRSEALWQCGYAGDLIRISQNIANEYRTVRSV
jgi:hypothetical protein